MSVTSIRYLVVYMNNKWPKLEPETVTAIRHALNVEKLGNSQTAKRFNLPYGLVYAISIGKMYPKQRSGWRRAPTPMPRFPERIGVRY